MFERFTDSARRVVVLAQEEARLLDHNYIGTEHELLGLIHERESVAIRALEALGIGVEDLRRQVEEIIGQGQQAPSGHIPFTPRAKRALELSLREALMLGHNYIGTEHILLGLIREDEGVAAQVLLRHGADLNRVRQVVTGLLHGYGASVDPPFRRDLTRAAAEGRLGPVVGREREIHDVMTVLQREPPGNPLLVGERGVGTSAIVHGVAQAIGRPDAPPQLAGTRVRELELAVLSRFGYRPDDLPELLHDVTDTIVFIGQARRPIRVLGTTMPAIDVLRPMLLGGKLQAIAAATPAEQRQWAGTDAELYRLFQPIAVRELSEELAAQALAELRYQYESRHQVAITDAAITAAVVLSVQHIPDQPLPGKAVTLIDRAAARAARRNSPGDVSRRPPGDLSRRIADVRARKEAAMDLQDFEAAAIFRNQELDLRGQEAAWQAEWKNTPAHRITSVTPEDVAQALGEDMPVSPRRTRGVSHV